MSSRKNTGKQDRRGGNSSEARDNVRGRTSPPRPDYGEGGHHGEYGEHDQPIQQQDQYGMDQLASYTQGLTFEPTYAADNLPYVSEQDTGNMTTMDAPSAYHDSSQYRSGNNQYSQDFGPGTSSTQEQGYGGYGPSEEANVYAAPPLPQSSVAHPDDNSASALQPIVPKRAFTKAVFKCRACRKNDRKCNKDFPVCDQCIQHRYMPGVLYVPICAYDFDREPQATRTTGTKVDGRPGTELWCDQCQLQELIKGDGCNLKRPTCRRCVHNTKVKECTWNNADRYKEQHQSMSQQHYSEPAPHSSYTDQPLYDDPQQFTESAASVPSMAPRKVIPFGQPLEGGGLAMHADWPHNSRHSSSSLREAGPSGSQESRHAGRRRQTEPVHRPEGQVLDYQDTYVDYQQPQQSQQPQPQPQQSFSSAPQLPQGQVPDYQDTYVDYQQPQHLQQAHNSQIGPSHAQLPQVAHTYNSSLQQSEPGQSYSQESSSSYHPAPSAFSPPARTSSRRARDAKPKPPTSEPKKGAVAWIDLEANGTEWVYRDPNQPTQLGYFNQLHTKWTGWVDHILDDLDADYDRLGYQERFILQDNELPIGANVVRNDKGEPIHMYWAFKMPGRGKPTKGGTSKDANIKSSAGKDSRHGSERRESHSSKAGSTGGRGQVSSHRSEAGSTPRRQETPSEADDSYSPFGFHEFLGADHPSERGKRDKDKSRGKGKGKERRH
jgi:hypothetical protein